MTTFTQQSCIFENENVLRDDYTPEKLIERDQEKSDYVEALQPVANGAQPRNVFVYGETGVGKTLATRIILAELERDTEQFDNVDPEIVWINCKDLTSYQVAIQLVNEFRTPTSQVSDSGHSRASVYNMLWDELEDCTASHVLIVLDEVDSLGTDDNLLYQVPRARSNGNIENTSVGLIGISNNFTFREDLSARVQSSLCEHEIHFSPYDANQLRAILQQRTEKAFINDVLDDDVIPLTAAFAGQDTGSARHALDIIYKAGSLARRDDDRKVTEDHVRKASDLVERGVIEDELRELPTQSHLVLFALSMLAANDGTPVRRNRIYEVYQTIANRIGADIKARRTVLNRLSQLSLKGFLKVIEVNKGRSGGKYHQYDLDVPQDLIIEILSENDRLREAMGSRQITDFA